MTEEQLDQVREDWFLFCLLGDDIMTGRGYYLDRWWHKRYGNVIIEMSSKITGARGVGPGISCASTWWMCNFSAFETYLRDDGLCSPKSKSKSS